MQISNVVSTTALTLSTVGRVLTVSGLGKISRMDHTSLSSLVEMTLATGDLMLNIGLL